MAPHRVVIVGGGFGGLNVARGLAGADLSLTLVDRRNFHLFQPLLYQDATGGLSPADIASPLRAVLKRQKNAAVLQATVDGIDPRARRLQLDDGSLEYDTLIVATGVCPHYFGRDDWREQAPGLKTIEDATRIRSRILGAFERAEREPDVDARRALMTFVIVGGGPTGVELAGAVGEMARHTLKGNFRRIEPAAARVLLVEGAATLLGGFPDRLVAAAHASLERLGVEVRCGARVEEITAGAVRLSTADGELQIASATILWAAGVHSRGFGARMSGALGLEADRLGRVAVAPDCSVPGHPEIFVIGDLANFPDPDGKPLPGVAPVAMQQGRYVARAIRARLAGRELPPFRYRNKGNLAVIGRAAAIADLGPRLQFSGYPAWLIWLLVHIMYLVEYENRVLVFVHWAFNYFTRNRGARLITGDDENAG